MAAPCKAGYVKSPKGRCVDADGPTGRRMRGLKPLPKYGPKRQSKKSTASCKAGKLRNPRTHRCISAMLLCHKMNGINPARFGNATAAACHNALTKTIAGVPVHLPAKRRRMSTRRM